MNAPRAKITHIAVVNNRVARLRKASISRLTPGPSHSVTSFAVLAHSRLGEFADNPASMCFLSAVSRNRVWKCTIGPALQPGQYNTMTRVLGSVNARSLYSTHYTVLLESLHVTQGAYVYSFKLCFQAVCPHVVHPKTSENLAFLRIGTDTGFM